MLLKHTPKEISKRSALTINPAKTCQPIGAMYAPWVCTGVCRTATVPKGAAPTIEVP